MAQKAQLKLLKDSAKAYGGDLFKTRKGRSIGRPLDTKNSMHLVLRSSLAKGPWSFHYQGNSRKIRNIIEKFSVKNGIKVISLANVGNHLHMQIKLSNRFTYKRFIKAITCAIAMTITGRNRWSKQKYIDQVEVTVGSEKKRRRLNKNEMALKDDQIHALQKAKLGFWDLRPFTRFIVGWKAVLSLKDYIRINEIEGWGFRRSSARNMLDVEKWLRSTA